MAKAFAGVCCGDAAACVVSTVSANRIITTLLLLFSTYDVVRLVWWGVGREVGAYVGSTLEGRYKFCSHLQLGYLYQGSFALRDRQQMPHCLACVVSRELHQ